ncbi:MFS transporter [Calidithermus chliarophilus]|uniref:MFS transporter n=1 Tax=Calidithermus chliarophilus TaxID=52023 RepID=UPI0004256795|nr:MFS transporter [Calidithermus chliarophilus]
MERPAVPPGPRLGLRENAAQFALLMLVNAMVGGMVGLERTVLPLVASEEFGLASSSAATSFIVSFGLTKALLNLASGVLADRLGRKPLLVLGWLFGLPVPFVLMFAPHWGWVVFANVLLGVNQGLAWSAAVVMKIDLVGPKARGLAVGLNEFAGYLAVGVTAWLTGYLAGIYGLRPAPFVPGVAYAVLGLGLSAFLVRDTRAHVRLEHESRPPGPAALPFRAVFARTSWRDPRLFAACQAGLVNNLNDGLSWGIFPLFFAAKGLPLEEIGLLKLVYPLVWSVLQVLTGPLSDRVSRYGLIAWGMGVQAAGIALTLLTNGLAGWLAAMVLLGAGTAMVYPTLIAVVGDASEPAWRARALGVYRFWRDVGYAAGALLAGRVADWLGFDWAIGLVAGLTFASGLIVASRRAAP